MSRFRNIAAASLAAIMAVTIASSASAGTVTRHAWTQKTAGLRCEDPVQGSADGGRILVVVSGQEARSSFAEFETSWVETSWHAWKLINGSWVHLYDGPVRIGHLGTVHLDGDGMYRGDFNWMHFQNMTHPSFKASVPTNGTWRLTVSTGVHQEDGVRVAMLVNTTGTCTFAG